MFNSDMSLARFLRKIALFCIPFLVWAAIVAAIDPFNIIRVSGLIEASIKRYTAQKYFPPLWKMIEYKRQPVPNILLGDSRMASIDPAIARRLTGIEYFNLAFGGGTFPEIRDAYWFAASQAGLKSVYMNLDIQLLNGLSKRNRIDEAEKIVKNPFLYFVDRKVIMAAAFAFYAQFFDKGFVVGKPKQKSKEDFWKFQIGVNARSYLEKYLYPDEFLADLKAIAEDCSEKGTRLVFVIMPTHTDLQKKTVEFGLTDSEARIKAELAGLAELLDLGGNSPFNAEYENFSDPYHLTKPALLETMKRIWPAEGREPGKINAVGPAK